MERHEKWTRVEPGTIIPAGQPFRVEYEDGMAREWPPNRFCDSVAGDDPSERATGWFVDSSWKPPLVLPTEPGSVIEATWVKGQASVLYMLTSDGRWITDRGYFAVPGTLHRVLFDAGAAR